MTNNQVLSQLEIDSIKDCEFGEQVDKIYNAKFTPQRVTVAYYYTTRFRKKKTDPSELVQVALIIYENVKETCGRVFCAVTDRTKSNFKDELGLLRRLAGRYLSTLDMYQIMETEECEKYHTLINTNHYIRKDVHYTEIVR